MVNSLDSLLQFNDFFCTRYPVRFKWIFSLKSCDKVFVFPWRDVSRNWQTLQDKLFGTEREICVPIMEMLTKQEEEQFHNLIIMIVSSGKRKTNCHCHCSI